MNESTPQLSFVVGEEKRLTEVIGRVEVEPLLRSLVKAGPLWAKVLDEDGLPLASHGDAHPLQECLELRQKLLLEGEPCGVLVLGVEPRQGQAGEALALLARDVLQMSINNNLKRMLTTEMHTTIVQESYEQLVESNRRLGESERRYRELALSLEQQVEERTAELRSAYARMLQQEKLAAVGVLAAGMAHEINNPNGFIRSNLATFDRYLHKLKEMLHYYQLAVADNTPLVRLQEESEERRRALKLDFILADAGELIRQSVEGSNRIARIVADLKSFSHVDESESAETNVSAELERTLAVLAPQIAARGRVETDVRPVPLFACNPGLLAQGFVAIIQNALQSRDSGLELRVSSRVEGEEIRVVIADNGCGIAPEHLTRVFEPFFTTRDVGSGTGMGLTVAREIVRGYGGDIVIDSRPGNGTTVTVRLPLGSATGG